MDSPRRLRLIDYLLVAVFSFILFGYSGISGRPLTMHEARLPETAREMKAAGEWLLPHSGIRPWLERPPLPHWVVIGSMSLFHRIDQEWVVRLPSAIMGLLTVLLTVWMAGRWFGRGIGVMSGLVLATSLEFYQYASLAEDDIYLGALVAICIALFVRAEFFSSAAGEDRRINFFKNRLWEVWAFFIVLGITNLAKGPLLGILIVGSAVGAYLLWNAVAEKHWRRLLRYVWLWGWLATILIGAAWPLWAYHRYPDVLANWKYDYLGRMNGSYSDINQPWFYYLPAWAAAMAPWTPACLIGLAATATATFATDFTNSSCDPRRVLRYSEDPDLPPKNPGLRSTSEPGVMVMKPPGNAYRFVWCWAIAPMILLSVPHGKHHHYLIPFLAPWAMLGAIGLVEIGKLLSRRLGPTWLRSPMAALCVLGLPGAVAIAWFHSRIPGPWSLTLGLLIFWLAVVGFFFIGLARGSGRLVMATVLVALLAGYGWGMTFVAAGTDQTVFDTAFLHRARLEVPANAPLFIDAKLSGQIGKNGKPDVGNLDFFRVQFYSRPDATLLHNLSYLRDENIKANEVYVIARGRDEIKLRELGTPRVIDQSLRSHDVSGPGGRITLFALAFDPHLARYPVPTKITSMQAMERDQSGPWCGPPM
jgi:4-amino-4-deoxy-L-arabinose transferase-like glycosyltransferase